MDSTPELRILCDCLLRNKFFIETFCRNTIETHLERYLKQYLEQYLKQFHFC